MMPYLILFGACIVLYFFISRAAEIHNSQLAAAQTQAYVTQNSAMVTPPPGADFPQAQTLWNYPATHRSW